MLPTTLWVPRTCRGLLRALLRYVNYGRRVCPTVAHCLPAGDPGSRRLAPPQVRREYAVQGPRQLAAEDGPVVGVSLRNHPPATAEEGNQPAVRVRDGHLYQR